LHV
jgi:hypothetical protein